MSSNFIGISYGTQYATVSVIEKEGKVTTIANEDGERNIPCYVEFTEHEEVNKQKKLNYEKDCWVSGEATCDQKPASYV